MHIIIIFTFYISAQGCVQLDESKQRRSIGSALVDCWANIWAVFPHWATTTPVTHVCWHIRSQLQTRLRRPLSWESATSMTKSETRTRCENATCLPSERRNGSTACEGEDTVKRGKCRPDAVWMLGQRLWRWPSIQTASWQRLVFPGYYLWREIWEVTVGLRWGWGQCGQAGHVHDDCVTPSGTSLCCNAHIAPQTAICSFHVPRQVSDPFTRWPAPSTVG